ncbi:MAG: AAA family ATPase [Acutalibacteraceae bacterium]
MAKKIVIASGKGGVGKTSIAVGLSKALAARGKKVIIVDCDTLRSVDLLVNAGETMLYDWGDVMLERCQLDDAIYQAGDICIMTCPHTYKSVTLKKMRVLMNLLDKKFDYIFLDSPAGVEMGFILSCIAADSGIVVSTPDPVCVRSVGATADEMAKYSVNDVRLIINRVVKRDLKRSRTLNFDSVIDMTEVQLIGVIPEDEKIRFATMGGKIYSRFNSSYKAFNNIAGRIEGDNIPLDYYC